MPVSELIYSHTESQGMLIPEMVCGLPAAALYATLLSTNVVTTNSTNVIEAPRALAVAARLAQIDATARSPEASIPATHGEDIASVDLSTRELMSWGRMMMGGDTSHMLDI